MKFHYIIIFELIGIISCSPGVVRDLEIQILDGSGIEATISSAPLCSEFVTKISSNRGEQIPGKYPFISDTFAEDFANRYRECLVGKDSSYIISLLGTTRNYEVAGFKVPGVELKYAMIYSVRTSKYHSENSRHWGRSIRLGFDSLNIVRGITVSVVNGSGVE